MPTTPIYQRLVDEVIADIRAGRLRPGDRLPTIEQYRQRYGRPGQPVSVTPIKMALRILEAQGLIYTHQGRGTFVADHPRLP